MFKCHTFKLSCEGFVSLLIDQWFLWLCSTMPCSQITPADLGTSLLQRNATLQPTIFSVCNEGLQRSGLHSIAGSFYLMIELWVHNDKTAGLLKVYMYNNLISTPDRTPSWVGGVHSNPRTSLRLGLCLIFLPKGLLLQGCAWGLGSATPSGSSNVTFGWFELVKLNRIPPSSPTDLEGLWPAGCLTLKGPVWPLKRSVLGIVVNRNIFCMMQIVG